MENPERRYELDWLKILAVGLVPVAHTLLFFTNTPYHLKNAVLSPQVDVITALLAVSIMPLFFIISGMSTAYSMRLLSNRQLLKSRILRLLVPFLFGLLTLAAVNSYYEALADGRFSGGFFDFYPTYFSAGYGWGGVFPWWGHHLYYLLVLFVYIVLGLPLFRWLLDPARSDWIDRAAGLLSRPGALYLLMVPIAIIEFLDPLAAQQLPRMGGWHMFSYFPFLGYGFLFALSQRFPTAFAAQQKLAAILVILMLVLGVPLLSGGDLGPAVLVALGIYGWSVVILLINIGQRWLRHPSRWLPLLAELALPLYIVHQAIQIAIGAQVLPLELSIAAKITLILATSIPLSLLAAALIRLTNPTRILFGLKPR